MATMLVELPVKIIQSQPPSVTNRIAKYEIGGTRSICHAEDIRSAEEMNVKAAGNELWSPCPPTYALNDHEESVP